MLKKEIMDTLKQTAAVLSLLLLIPIVYWANTIRIEETLSFATYMQRAMYLDLVLLNIALAYMMFAREGADDAVEYLKTLPFSKWKLLGIKILPRLFVLLIPILASIIHLAISSPGALRYLFFVTLWPAILQTILVVICGFFLGLADRRNPVLVFTFALIITYPFLIGPIVGNMLLGYPIQLLGWEVFYYQFLKHLVSALPVLLPIAMLIPVYRSWDCRSKKIQSQIMLKRMALPVMLIVGLWVVVFSR